VRVGLNVGVCVCASLCSHNNKNMNVDAEIMNTKTRKSTHMKSGSVQYCKPQVTGRWFLCVKSLCEKVSHISDRRSLLCILLLWTRQRITKTNELIAIRHCTCNHTCSLLYGLCMRLTAFVLTYFPLKKKRIPINNQIKCPNLNVGLHTVRPHGSLHLVVRGRCCFYSKELRK